jgi:hypothetical protein
MRRPPMSAATMRRALILVFVVAVILALAQPRLSKGEPVRTTHQPLIFYR